MMLERLLAVPVYAFTGPELLAIVCRLNWLIRTELTRAQAAEGGSARKRP